METTVRSLESKLNLLIDEENKKKTESDAELILACCDGLIRLENFERYVITETAMREKLEMIKASSGKVRRVPKAVKVLLIAALIALLVSVAALGYAQLKYDIFHYPEWSTVHFSLFNNEKVYDLNVGYIPEGFALVSKDHKRSIWCEDYYNGSIYFSIGKEYIPKKTVINTEYGDSKVVSINGIDYIVFGEEIHGRGIMWISGKYKYSLASQLSEEEMMKIALSVS